MADPHVIDEFLVFLSPSARPDLKARAMQYVLGLTTSADGTRLLFSHAGSGLRLALVTLTRDTNERIAADAFRAVINLTAHVSGDDDCASLANDLASDKNLTAHVSGDDDCATLMTLANDLASDKNLLALLLRTIVDKSSRNADNASKALTNLTRIPVGCRNTMDVLGEADFPVDLVQLVEAFCTKSYNDQGERLDYLGTVLANLTQLPEGRQFVLDKERCVVQRLLPYTQYAGSTVRRRGGVAALKNCCFETDYHDWLLSNAIDILPHLLLPLAGPEELTEEEMEGMPEELQYLEEDKTREEDADIKRMLMEAIMKLCSTKSGRKIVKDKRAYIIMREYHKSEREASLDQPIEELIQMLIGDEPEPGMENLNEVQVPDHIAESLEQTQEQEASSTKEL